ncbi:unnamed protein product, partial [Mesorhabditis spiculigera]
MAFDRVGKVLFVLDVLIVVYIFWATVQKKASFSSSGCAGPPAYRTGTLLPDGWVQIVGKNFSVYWGLVKEPYYYPDAALEVIYGGMGLTIGHELAHTFDNNILAYNRSVLVGPEDNQQYDAQVECIQHQYENATVPYEFSNGTFSQPGELTDGEAIADNMGLRTSFRAYRTERNRLYGNDPPALKGLEQYTPDQLFYVAAGLMHCAHEGDNQLRVLLADVHPPGKIRMNEMMRNSKQFSEVFKCPFTASGIKGPVAHKFISFQGKFGTEKTKAEMSIEYFDSQGKIINTDKFEAHGGEGKLTREIR